MRVVVDTNVVISGLFWRGAPQQLLNAARSHLIDLFTSPVLLAELSNVLRRDKFAERLAAIGVESNDLIMGYAALAKVIKPADSISIITDDPDDNSVLECAIAAHADVIVSGDHHLLKMSSFRNVPILTTHQMLEQISK